jgi:hypothetical protein
MKRVAFVLAISLLAPAAASAAPGAAPAKPPAQQVPSAQQAPSAPAGAPAASRAPQQAPVERRLFSDTIEASSFLWNDWNRFQENYHPNYLADDDPATGWVEGAENSGAGSWVRLAVTPLAGTSVVRLKIRNGYQKSAALFKANARAKGVTLKLLPSGKTVKATLTDKQGWQEVAIDQPAGELRGVELDVDSVYEGSKYADLVISDVQVFATSTTRDNPTFEKSKRTSLLDWRKARMAAAKLFKAGRGDALPLYGSYRAVERTLSAEVKEAGNGGSMSSRLAAAALDPGFAEWRDAVKLAQAVADDYDTLQRAQISPLDNTSVPEVDGFEQLALSDAYEGVVQDHAMRLPVLDNVSAFFAEKLRVLDQKGEKYSEYQQGVYMGKCRPATWVKRAKAIEATAPDRVVALLVARCGEVESREGTTMVAALQLLVFGKDGRLALVVGDAYVDGYRWEAGGKIAGGKSMQYDTSVELVKGQVAAK